MQNLTRSLLVFLFLILTCAEATAQLKPEDLNRDDLVKLFLKDSSNFYALVLAKPIPDRIIVETRYGRLEIPLKNISHAIDYRFNYVLKDDLKQTALKNNVDAQEFQLTKYLSRPKLPDTSVVHTKDHDTYKGKRVLFNDSAHVILTTSYGNLFFKYPAIDYVDNWSGQGDRREEFLTSTYLTVYDPKASQTFLMPTAHEFGEGKVFINDYMLAGLQFNYGPTNWLSLNGGGVFAPFLPTQVLTATAGFKVTPVHSELFSVAAGAQGVYSEVVKVTRIGFPYVVATYGTWESQLSILGGLSFKNEIDSTGLYYTAKNPLLGISGSTRMGENLKLMTELFFISDFPIVPIMASIRYFQNDLTIDIGVVISAYKSGYADNTPTLGEYVFNKEFKLIPMVSGSYHF